MSKRPSQHAIRLVPVPSLGECPPLAELLAWGRTVAASRTLLQEALRRDLRMVGLMDQAEAHEVAMSERLVTHTPLGFTPYARSFDDEATIVKALTQRSALLALTGYRVAYRCPHIAWPPSAASAALVNLSTRTATCERLVCIAAVPAGWRDDGCCDACCEALGFLEGRRGALRAR